MKRLLSILCLPFVVVAACSAENAPDVPSNLVAEGIPPIPAELKTNVARYLALGGARFRGWNTERREMMVTTRTGEVTELYLVSEPMGKRTVLTTLSEPVTSGWFQPGNGNRLVFQSDKGGNEQFQFYALDLTTKSVTLLTDGASRNTGALWSHDGSLLAYTSSRRNGRDNNVFLVNPADPATTHNLITNSSPAWSVADWSRDDAKLLLVQGVSDQQTNLWLANVKTGERKLITPKGEKVFYNRAQFAENDAAIYAATDDGSDFLTLTRLDTQTGARTPLTANIPWDVEDFRVSPDGRTLAFVTNENGFSKLHLLDVATRKALPVPKIPGDVITSLSWHEKRRELGFSLDSSQSPNDAYSLDVDSGVLTRWTARTRAVAMAQKYAEPQLIPIQSFDGLGISALVYRPDPLKFPGKRPAIVSIHGGPSSQSRPGFRGNANYYVNELGMVLVYPNVRGSLGYGRKFLALDNGFNRENAVQDIGAVLDWMSKDPEINSSRVGVMGGSYGGYMTLASLVKYADAFRCGVETVGITNFVTFLENTSDYRRANRRAEYGDERKPEMRAFLEKISPANHATEIKASLFIIQGENDPRVPATEAKQMRDAIQKNGGSVWYLMAADEGHGFTKKKNLDFQFDATVLFFQEHLLK